MNTRKIASFVVGATMLLGPVALFADTTASTSASVSAMLQQIQAFQAQIQALQAARASLNTAQTNVIGTLKLIRSLKQGMSGSDVSALQAILAADPSIYPSGNITGFFGQMTAEAVKKYQKKHGLSALGIVGPLTLKELNKDKDDLGLTEEHATSTKGHDENDNDHEDNGKRFCIPPGHMIAPGWLKHNEKPVPTAAIPLCNQKEDDHRGGNGTTTPDTLAPLISVVAASNITGSTTQITWTTNELSNSKVWVSTISPISTAGAPSVMNSNLVLSHSMSLSGLATSTTYFYVVGSADTSANTATSSQGSFITLSI